MHVTRNKEMPTNVPLDLTLKGASAASTSRRVSEFRASDYRLHGGPDLLERHWLLQHPLGRELLVTNLWRVRPDARVNRFHTAPEHEVLLEGMVDSLGLREWPRPTTFGERIRVSLMLLRYGFAMGGFKSPDWRSMYANRRPA
jgi:hypothetical protein